LSVLEINIIVSSSGRRSLRAHTKAYCSKLLDRLIRLIGLVGPQHEISTSIMQGLSTWLPTLTISMC